MLTGNPNGSLKQIASIHTAHDRVFDITFGIAVSLLDEDDMRRSILAFQEALQKVIQIGGPPRHQGDLLQELRRPAALDRRRKVRILRSCSTHGQGLPHTGQLTTTRASTRRKTDPSLK